jgi:hypothetical protein
MTDAKPLTVEAVEELNRITLRTSQRARPLTLLEQRLLATIAERDRTIDDFIRRLRESVRCSYLFGNFDEPLDDSGKRVLRVVIDALAAAKGEK